MSHEKNRSTPSEKELLRWDVLFQQLERNPPGTLSKDELDDDNGENWEERSFTSEQIRDAVEKQKERAEEWEQAVNERMEERYRGFFFGYLQEKHEEFKEKYFPEILNSSKSYSSGEQFSVVTKDLTKAETVLFQATPPENKLFLTLAYLKKAANESYEILHIFEGQLVDGDDKTYPLPKKPGSYVCVTLLSNLHKPAPIQKAPQPEKRDFLKEILRSASFVRIFPFSI